MKIKIIFLAVTILALACKDESKNNKTDNDKININKKENNLVIIEKIILPNYSLWTLNRLTLKQEDNEIVYNGENAFNLQRTSTNETAYASVNNIAVLSGRIYKISLIVKKAEWGGLFGLRVIGEYPNRVDAVYDLNNGLCKGVEEVGDFFDGESSIEVLNDGWYRCNLIARVNSEKIKIILGPTSGFGKIITWEAATTDKCNTYIIPSSLTLEEISF